MALRDLPRARRVASVLLGLALLVATGAPQMVAAAPAGSGSPRKSGPCTQSAAWNLAVKKVASGLEVVFTISKGPAKDRWTVFMDDNGSGFYADSLDASKRGIVKVTAVIPNLAGTDTISAAAIDRATGETCDGRVRV